MPGPMPSAGDANQRTMVYVPTTGFAEGLSTPPRGLRPLLRLLLLGRFSPWLLMHKASFRRAGRLQWPRLSVLRMSSPYPLGHSLITDL